MILRLCIFLGLKTTIRYFLAIRVEQLCMYIYGTAELFSEQCASCCKEILEVQPKNTSEVARPVWIANPHMVQKSAELFIIIQNFPLGRK